MRVQYHCLRSFSDVVGACSLPLLVRVLVSEPVWLSGKVSERDVGSNPLRLSFLFKKLWSVDIVL